jgi:ATP phosphoribosyltransferase
VSKLLDTDWVDLSAVAEERGVRELIPRRYEAGAPGIIEVPIDKILE